MRSVAELLEKWLPKWEFYQPLPPDYELMEEQEAEELADRERNKLARQADAEGALR